MVVQLFAATAHADFDVCNKGETATIYLATASQENSVFSQPYSLHGWSKLAPGTCDTIATGDISEHTYWLHAEVNGVTLTADYAVNGYAGERQFCITDGAFNDSHASAASSCSSGERLATFPIYSTSIWRDHEVHLRADDIQARTPSRSNNGREYLPSLFGALVYDKTNRYYAAYLHKSAASARTKAIEYCRNESSAAATCELKLEFADQCVVILNGDKDPVYLATGNHSSGKQATQQWSMKRCEARGNKTCKEDNVICSTSEEQFAQNRKRDQEFEEKALKGMGEVLKEIWK
jgi:uncharacterized membrane protein